MTAHLFIHLRPGIGLVGKRSFRPRPSRLFAANKIFLDSLKQTMDNLFGGAFAAMKKGPPGLAFHLMSFVFGGNPKKNGIRSIYLLQLSGRWRSVVARWAVLSGGGLFFGDSIKFG